MGDGVLVLIFTFWSSFFTALSLNELFFRPKDPVENRLDELARAESRGQEQVAVLERKESRAGPKEEEFSSSSIE